MHRSSLVVLVVLAGLLLAGCTAVMPGGQSTTITVYSDPVATLVAQGIALATALALNSNFVIGLVAVLGTLALLGAFSKAGH